MKYAAAWFANGKAPLDYRPAHTFTMSDKIKYIEPKKRVYREASAFRKPFLFKNYRGTVFSQFKDGKTMISASRAGLKTVLILLTLFLLACNGISSRAAWPVKPCTPTKEDWAKQALLVGVWTGRYSFDDDGEYIEFISRNQSDGSYLLLSRGTDPGGAVETDEETGEWEVCANTYIAMPKTTDGEPIRFFEFPPRFEYKILSISEQKFVYRDVNLETTFEATRVPDDFEFPPL